MKSLAVLVSRGSANHFIQVLTLLMAGVHAEMRLRVLFRDEAVWRLTPERMNALNLEGALAQDLEATRRRLQKLDLVDLAKLCRDIKASGDVKYYACSSSLAIYGLSKEHLIPEIDEVRGLPAFLLEDVAAADRVLTF